MSNCVLCKLEIKPATAVVSIAGGLFPATDPDFFMLDATVLPEAYAHRECFMKLVQKPKPKES